MNIHIHLCKHCLYLLFDITEKERSLSHEKRKTLEFYKIFTKQNIILS